MISDQTLRQWLPAHTVALLGDLIRVLLWITVIASWVYFSQPYLKSWRMNREPGGTDFTMFYYGARLLADGRPMYESPAVYGIPWHIDHMGNLNPPHFQTLLQPLASLSYSRAFEVWCVANLLALAGSVMLVLRTLNVKITAAGVAVWGCLAIAAAPFTAVAATSEWSFLLLLPFTAAWATARKREWVNAGLWLGCCIAFKLFFLLFVPWLLIRRRWGALGAAAAAVLAWTAFGIAMHGAETYVQWFESMRMITWWSLPANASWHGTVSRVFEGGYGLEEVVRLPSVVTPASHAGSALVGVASLWAALRLERQSNGIDAAILVLLTGAVLASPLGWVYYLPLAIGPLAGVITTSWWRQLPAGWIAAALVAAWGLYISARADRGEPALSASHADIRLRLLLGARCWLAGSGQQCGTDQAFGPSARSGAGTHTCGCTASGCRRDDP